MVATDEATVYYEFVDQTGFNNELMKKVVQNNEEKISQQTKTDVKPMPASEVADVVAHETSDIKFGVSWISWISLVLFYIYFLAEHIKTPCNITLLKGLNIVKIKAWVCST